MGRTSHAAAKVDRLIAELRDALAECGQGPLRATIDSDGHGTVQSLVGRPLIDGRRIVGLAPLMSRTLVGPELQPRDIHISAH